MTYIGLDLYGTTTLYGMTTMTNSTIKDDNAASSTALGLATTLSNAASSNHFYMNATTKYIDSLSNEQLCEFVNRLDEREEALLAELNTDQITINEPKKNDNKVYTKYMI